MRFYDYKCRGCGKYLVDSIDEIPPLCVCGERMIRVFTPCNINVKGGTPNFHGVVSDYQQKAETEQGIKEYEVEQKKYSEGVAERQKIDEQFKRDYCRGELHHKHGNPDEALK